MAGSEDLTPEQLRLEALCLGFRTREGVALEVIQGHPRWRLVLSELTQAGLVRPGRRPGGGYRPGAGGGGPVAAAVCGLTAGSQSLRRTK